MRYAALDLLACPVCHAELTLQDGPSVGPVRDGYLICSDCELQFLVQEGIPRFLETEDLEGSDRRFAHFYDRFSGVYAPFMRLGFLPFGGDRRARMAILQHLQPIDGRVLEVSIGPGVNLPYLFEMPEVREVHGLDISLGQLRRCQRFADKGGYSVDLCLGTAESLPYRNDVFGSVFHIGGINFFNGKREAVAEMIRVAKPGARIVIADETERVAGLFARMLRFPATDAPLDAPKSTPLTWVPQTVDELEMRGIWRAHGRDHGFCLSFRKPKTPA